MRALWKGFWQLSKTERIGYLLLLALLGLHLTLDLWGPRPLHLSQELLASVPQVEPAIDTLHDSAFKKEAALFYFDINTAAPNELKRLGLKEKSISGLMRFRSKGGKVRNEADFNKLFSLTDADKERLRPWLRLPQEDTVVGVFQRNISEPEKKEGPKVFVRIDLNTADSSHLITVPGIGPAFASRIIRYRDRLGGFVNLAQLREVFGIDSAKYDALWPLLEVREDVVKKWHPCEVSEEALATHPYIGKVIARRWVAYRQQRGCTGCSEFERLPGMDAARWKKLVPYFDCTGLH